MTKFGYYSPDVVKELLRTLPSMSSPASLVAPTNQYVIIYLWPISPIIKLLKSNIPSDLNSPAEPNQGTDTENPTTHHKVGSIPASLCHITLPQKKGYLDVPYYLTEYKNIISNISQDIVVHTS
ncbi:hypothetical protein O181_052772 [Austropuccinia psidii MF-1]|uniref:Uncharacterized protein n=1 Tax=Austropuccinia psidii MF-1 TaxID=1389203 RepID=A0A9Q3HQW0_9BASI|nr:hypothetical protein [Austropuccinia psidii MF-1]